MPREAGLNDLGAPGPLPLQQGQGGVQVPQELGLPLSLWPASTHSDIILPPPGPQFPCL